MTNETTTHTLRSDNVPTLFALVEKLNKRAKRLGVALITVVVLARRTETRRHPNTDLPYEVSLTDVELVGEEIKLNGWKLVGVIEHDGSDCIVRSAGTDYDLSAYRTADPLHCDHCGTRRNRKDSFVLLHDDGREVRVGRSCLKDYLGHGSVNGLIWKADATRELAAITDSEEYLGGSGNGFDGMPLDEYLGWVAMSIRHSGWLSRSAADERSGMATADDAIDAMFNKKRTERPTEEDFAQAAAAIEWVKADLEREQAERGLNDYQHNLSVILSKPTIILRRVGYAASIVSYYERGLGREIEKRERAKRGAELAATSQHVGEIKERLDLTGVTVNRIHSFEGQFGTTFIINMIHDGNVLVWFASREQDVKVGDTVTLRGTVKKHDDYKGTAQTTLTRCKVSKAS